MAYEVRPNTGSLFRNDKKTTENHPDYTGSANVDGADYFLDSWINESKDGKKYMSLKLKRKDVQSGNAPPQRGEPRRAYDDDDSDSIPF